MGEPTNVQKYTYMKTGWNDLLHTYNNRIVTHDDLGNPLRYRDNLRFTWVGRLMATAKTSATATSSYSYAQSGLRLKKEYQDGTEVVTHTYDYDGTLLVREKYGDTTLWFMYDESGSPIGFIKQDGTTRTPYYYVKNAQGDVLAITNGGAGTILCKYQYDSWGKLLAVKDSYGNDISSDKNNIANINPIRYRGYYYDTETGLYYLQSRYYDPVMGRFVNADSIADTGAGLLATNLYIYAANNPINNSDPTGHWIIKDAIKWVTKNIARPVTKVVRRRLSKVKATYSKGLNISASPSLFNYNLQGGVTIDTSGNIALTGSLASGFTGGTPGLSLTGYDSITNAPSVDKTSGFGMQIGGTAAVPVDNIPIAVGGDFNILEDPDNDCYYWGITTNGGFGTPGGELHIELGNTLVWEKSKQNIFDIADNIYVKIMEW